MFFKLSITQNQEKVLKIMKKIIKIPKKTKKKVEKAIAKPKKLCYNEYVL